MKFQIHEVKDSDTCCFTGKTAEVFVLSTDDGFLAESAISPRGLMQLAKMKFGHGKKATAPSAVPVNSGEE